MTAALVAHAASANKLALVVDFTTRELIASDLGAVDLQHVECDEVRLDFHCIAALGSLELAALINFCVKARSLQKRVVATNVGPVVREVFEVTRFSRLAEVRLAPEDARPKSHGAWLFRRTTR